MGSSTTSVAPAWTDGAPDDDAVAVDILDSLLALAEALRERAEATEREV
jgi:hypothetical protein